MRIHKILFQFAFVLITLSVLGCENGSYQLGKGWVMPIQTINEYPNKFREKKAATISGIVVKNITVAGYSGYRLRDKTGNVVVIGKASPVIGAKTYVKGHCEKLLGIGSFAVEVFIMDE